MASNTKTKTKKASPKGGAKKSAPKQQPLKQESVLGHFKREIWGGVCLLLALLIILSGLDKSSALARFFMGMAGQVGLIVLPIGLALCAVALIFHGGKPVTMRVLCSLSFALLVCAIAHHAIDQSEAKWGTEMFGVLYREGAQNLSGGVLGGLLYMLFCLPGGRPVGLAICILLLLVTLPASLNLTLTGLLRAINEHRDELRRQDKPARKEPAEVLVERAIQHRENRDERRQVREERRQEREERRQEKLELKNSRRRFDYDLPIDDPDEEKPQPKEKTAEKPIPVQLPLTPVETPRPARKSKISAFDLPIDDPVTAPAGEEGPAIPELKPAQKPKTTYKPELKPEPVPDFPPEPADAAPESPAIKPLPSDKVKARDARKAAAEIEAQIAGVPASASEKPSYVYPPIELLNTVANGNVDASAEMRENTRRLQEKLACFNVDAQIVNVTRGPNVTMYELQLAQGVRLSKLTGLSDDIALELGAPGVRISAIPDKNSMVGIEVPNKQVSTVSIREVIDSREFRSAKSKISFAVGKDINGNAIVGDIAKMPHILIAGTTGSGKSVCMNSLIISLLFKATPEEVKLIMVDPKMVELGIYNGIPHLLIPVVTDPKKAAGALQWAVTEMMRRYRMMSDSGVREIESYNKLAAQTGEKHMEKIVVVIDELADLMMVAGKEVEESICRIAQMGRAAGVHLVIATQRPSADVITGLMKANIPSRIAFAVSSAMESRIILDTMGAEKLIGRGDMLFAPLGKGKKRVQGCLIEDSEVQAVTDFIKAQGSAEYSDEIQQQIELRAAQSGKNGGSSGSGAQSAPAESDAGDGDELLPAAVEVILETKQASVSMLQRRLKLGYARAARIVDEMEERGIVGPFEGSKPRQLLITKEQWDAMQNGGAAPTQPDAEPVEDLIE